MTQLTRFLAKTTASFGGQHSSRRRLQNECVASSKRVSWVIIKCPLPSPATGYMPYFHTDEEREFYQLQKGIAERVLRAWVFQTGLFGAIKPILFLEFPICLIFILGGQFLLPHRVARKGKSPNSGIGWQRGLCVPVAFKLDHLQPIKPILFMEVSVCFIFIIPRA